jgi:hypothetical protein
MCDNNVCSDNTYLGVLIGLMVFIACLCVAMVIVFVIWRKKHKRYLESTPLPMDEDEAEEHGNVQLQDRSGTQLE